MCKEENEKFKEELREKVNTLEQELLLCKEENEKLKEKLKKKVNTLEQDLLLCKEENEKFKEELKKKDQQEGDKQTIDIKNGQQADIIMVKGMDVDEKGDDVDKRDADHGITERQFLAKKKELELENMEGLIIERPLPLMLKELVKLWDKDDSNLPWEKRKYNESNSLLVDDSPYKALLNPAHTAIFLTSYDIRNKNDNSLRHGADIRMYLEGLTTSENVQKYI
ncbi:hypothetical protein IFM89_011333 [Coptis chinensis]|uniref:FCP1 homology domain-containing protein n=1 Tax=Coptis chinensis TaxID=261450 RepID=A0A835IW91_9MAGN|nr:hypothetical protein IFM89_011333 [Coptis chinensis]